MDASVASLRRVDDMPGTRGRLHRNTHVIAFMIAWALGKPITNEQKQAIHKDYLGHASITSFTFETDSIDEIPEFTYLVPLE